MSFHNNRFFRMITAGFKPAVVVLGLFCCFGARPLLAAEDPRTFSFYFENDLFAGTDQSYTNGLKISWVSGDLSRYADSERLPAWALPYINALPFIHQPGYIRNVTLSMGQSMYTPRDITRSDLIVDDRPYGGWTYLGIGLHSKNRTRLDTIEIQIGVVGPLSHAEEAQRLVHELRNLQVPNGWDHQLRNEPGLLFIYEQKKRLGSIAVPLDLELDAITNLGGALGNVSTYANTGMMVRLGRNLPLDFGASLIRPAGDAGAPADQKDLRISGLRHFGMHVFGAINGTLVLRDIFLDGNTFKNSHSVDKKHGVAEVAAGLGLVYRRAKLTYAHVLRTREYDGQPEPHSFGSITLSVSY